VNDWVALTVGVAGPIATVIVAWINRRRRPPEAGGGRD
jgi:hypothetical protein